MDTLKELGEKGVLALVGFLLVVVALAGKANFWGLEIPQLEIFPRWVLGFLGFFCFGLLVAIHLLDARKDRQAIHQTPQLLAADAAQSGGGSLSAPTKVQAEDFFTTVDDRRIGSFTDRAGGCSKVTIMARTIVNLMASYGHVFERLAANGCDVEVLVVDPDSSAVGTMYGKKNEQAARRNIQGGLQPLKALQEKHPNKIAVRYLNDAPNIGIIRFKKYDSAESFIQVVMYLFHGAVGADRPVFSISDNDKWYEIFDQELNELWNSAPTAILP